MERQAHAGGIMKRQPEEIVIIGGGLLGCLAALFAARIRLADGSPMYHVTLLEKNPRLLSGAAMVVARDHSTGMEYPKSPQTGEACTESSIILNRVWEGVDHIHVAHIHEDKEETMRFDVDEELHHFSDFRKEEHLAHLKTMIMAANGVREQCGLPLLPLPELADTGLSIPTGEKGLDIPRRMSLLVLALTKAQHRGNLEIKCGFDAQEIKAGKDGKGFIVEGYQRDEFIDGIPTKAVRETIRASQVFNASWEGLLKIKLPPHCEQPSLKATCRSIALLDISGVPKNVASRFFIDPLPGGYKGGMFSRFNRRGALAYIPYLAYENWEQPGYKEENHKTRYMEAIQDRFPELANARMKALLKHKTLVEQEKEYSERQYVPVTEMEAMPGLWWGAALKGIYAERLAIEAVAKLCTRSISEKFEGVTPEDFGVVLNMVTQEPAYRIKEALGLDNSIAVGHPRQSQREIDYLKDRGMLFEGQMLNEESYHYYRTQYRDTEQKPSRRAGGGRGR